MLTRVSYMLYGGNPNTTDPSYSDWRLPHPWTRRVSCYIYAIFLILIEI